MRDLHRRKIFFVSVALIKQCLSVRSSRGGVAMMREYLGKTLPDLFDSSKIGKSLRVCLCASQQTDRQIKAPDDAVRQTQLIPRSNQSSAILFSV